jgi:cell division protein FtsW
MVSRLERSPLANWWWTVDRWLIAALGALIVLGLVLTLAASPSVAERLGMPPFYFVNRQILFLVPAIAVLFATSFLSPRHVRRAA